MSVINQVLRDLDKRQQTAQGARVRSHYQPAGGRPWLWAGAFSVAIVLSAVVTWWLVANAMSDKQSPAAEPQVQVVQPMADEEAGGEDTDAGRAEQNVAVAQLEQVQPANAHMTAQSDRQQSTDHKAEAPRVVTTAPQKSSVNDRQATSREPATEAVTQVEASAQSTDATPQAQAPTEESRGEMRVERVERSASELAAQRLEQAIGAMESGEGRKAETLLQEALVLAPQFVDAREQLAAYYYGRGFSSEALRVLRDGLAHAPGNTRLLTLSARIYEESGRADEALGMLNRIDAELPRQADIVVLRAALANELGQFQLAADDYRQLLATNANKGIWWLGLALAEEGREQYEAARLAYQRAGEDMTLDRASREFAREREEALAAW